MAKISSIGRGTVVRGSVRGEGDLDIQGRVEGSVAVSGELVIGETALIKSDVSGRRVIVRGAIAGNVSAEESLVLERGARVVGDLGAPQIGIRPGALVRGNVSTHGEAAPKPRTARVEAREPVLRAPAVSPKAPIRPPAEVLRKPEPKAPVAVAKEAPRPAPPAPPPPAPAAVKPPPPVLPSLKRGSKAALKRKSAR